jgi:hypothetical protein
MKKTLIITTVSGEKIEKDLEKDSLNAPIGAGANHPVYVGLVQFLAVNGMPLTETTAKHLKYLPPSQILSIEVFFS